MGPDDGCLRACCRWRNQGVSQFSSQNLQPGRQVAQAVAVSAGGPGSSGQCRYADSRICPKRCNLLTQCAMYACGRGVWACLCVCACVCCECACLRCMYQQSVHAGSPKRKMEVPPPPPCSPSLQGLTPGTLSPHHAHAHTHRYRTLLPTYTLGRGRPNDAPPSFPPPTHHRKN